MSLEGEIECLKMVDLNMLGDYFRPREAVRGKIMVADYTGKADEQFTFKFIITDLSDQKNINMQW